MLRPNFHPVASLAMALLLALSCPLQAATPAPETLLSDTRAARDARRYTEAEALARKGMASSTDPVWPLTLSLVLTDQGRTKEALAILETPHPIALPKADRLLAEGYAKKRAGDDWEALRAYGEALRLRPGNAEAQQAMAAILDTLRAPHAAARLGGTPDRRIADKAAALTRWGTEVRAEAIEKRYSGTDQALAAQDALLARLAADPASDPALVRRIRLDRMIALRDRVRMAEVVQEGAALSADGVTLPSYVEQAYADALLHQRQPEAALAAYDRLLAAEPEKIQARYGRVFALVEMEDFAAAYGAADAIAASRPRFVGFQGGPATSPDPEFTYATLLAGEVRLWGNQTAKGNARIAPLAAGAPANASVRRSHAGALAARGWPRAAEAETKIAASLQPETLESRISLTETALARNRLDDAAEESVAIVALVPENMRVRRLVRDIAAARGWGLEADIAPTFNRGGGTNGLGQEWTASGRLESPTLGNGVRLFALADTSRATPPEGRVRRSRAGGGIALRTPDIAATAYATGSWSTLSGAGAGASLNWAASDQLSFGIEGEIFSRQTPLRALYYGIKADSVAVSGSWRRDERFGLSANASWVPFSDGNDRLSAGVSATALLIAIPHFDLTGRVDLYTSHNSKPGGPYFSPESDFSASTGLLAQHVVWRRYERAFVQVFSLEVGVYDQQDFAADWIAVGRYEHRWRQNPRTEIHYGITIDRRVFDGVGERGIALSAGIRQRF